MSIHSIGYVKWNNFTKDTIYPNSQVKNTQCEHISIKEIEGKEGGSRCRTAAWQEQGPEIKPYQHTKKKVCKKQSITFQNQKVRGPVEFNGKYNHILQNKFSQFPIIYSRD
jgi:hypothetical protein